MYLSEPMTWAVREREDMQKIIREKYLSALPKHTKYQIWLVRLQNYAYWGRSPKIVITDENINSPHLTKDEISSYLGEYILAEDK